MPKIRKSDDSPFPPTTGKGVGGVKPRSEIQMPRPGENMRWRTKNDSRLRTPSAPPAAAPRARMPNPLDALNKETRRGVENLANAAKGIGGNFQTTLNLFRPKRK